MEHRISIFGVLIWSAVFLLAGGVFALGWFIFFSDYFRIKTVEIRGNAFLTEAEIIEMLSDVRLNERHIWFANLEEIGEQLEGNHRIETVEFETVPPDAVILKIVEPCEFATVSLPEGYRCTVDRDGNFIRWLIDNEAQIGPIIHGFSKTVLMAKEQAYQGFKDEIEAWSGYSSRPEAAGVLRNEAEPSDAITVLRERIRFGDALRLAEATGINRRPDVSGYRYIGLDVNFDLFLAYPELPPVIVGGYYGGSGTIDDLSKMIKHEEPAELICYDYIDMHLAGFGRGIKLSKLGTFALREWSDRKEAVRIAAWETLGEVESRL
jgi:hypothetical protein